MLEVDIDKILPVTEARDNFNKIIDEVEGTDHMYVLTKNGKPSAVVVGVNHLEKLTGKTADELTSIVEKKADKPPVVEEVKSEAATDSAAMPASGSGSDGSTPPQPELSTPAEIAESPIDVPVEEEETPVGNTGGEARAESPMPTAPPAPTANNASAPSTAPTSSPVSASAEATLATSNQPPAVGQAAAGDSDLFV